MVVAIRYRAPRFRIDFSTSVVVVASAGELFHVRIDCRFNNLRVVTFSALFHIIEKLAECWSVP